MKKAAPKVCGGKACIESLAQRGIGGGEVAFVGLLLGDRDQRQDDRFAEHGEALPQHVGNHPVGSKRDGAQIMREQKPVDALTDGGDAKG